MKDQQAVAVLFGASQVPRLFLEGFQKFKHQLFKHRINLVYGWVRDLTGHLSVILFVISLQELSRF